MVGSGSGVGSDVGSGSGVGSDGGSGVGSGSGRLNQISVFRIIIT
jgi:hypothetical protein